MKMPNEENGTAPENNVGAFTPGTANADLVTHQAFTSLAPTPIPEPSGPTIDSRFAALERDLQALAGSVTGLTSSVATLANQVADLTASDATRTDPGAVLTDSEAEHVRFVLNKYHAHERP
jgi:hypothetical protein